jgi:hypothetical protein
MYGGGRIPYVDALFFASGAATQSGLNTYAERLKLEACGLTGSSGLISTRWVCINRYMQIKNFPRALY